MGKRSAYSIHQLDEAEEFIQCHRAADTEATTLKKQQAIKRLAPVLRDKLKEGLSYASLVQLLAQKGILVSEGTLRICLAQADDGETQFDLEVFEAVDKRIDAMPASAKMSKQAIIAKLAPKIFAKQQEGHSLEAIAQWIGEGGLPLTVETLRTCLKRNKKKTRATSPTKRTRHASAGRAPRKAVGEVGEESLQDIDMPAHAVAQKNNTEAKEALVIDSSDVGTCIDTIGPPTKPPVLTAPTNPTKGKPRSNYGSFAMIEDSDDI